MTIGNKMTGLATAPLGKTFLAIAPTAIAPMTLDGSDGSGSSDHIRSDFPQISDTKFLLTLSAT